MPARSFKAAIAIVTGAASGIGLALSRELARRGATVVLCDIDAQEAAAAAEEIRAAGGDAWSCELDVSQADAFAATATQVLERHGQIDFLFNNAGIGVSGEIADYTVESWRRIIDVNIGGVAHGVQAVYPRMLEQGFGHIVNTASMAGLIPSPGLGSYSMSKHAVVGLSRNLRLEASRRGVRVSVFCPGVIRTPILSGGRHGIFLGQQTEARQRQVAARVFERLRPMDPARFAARALDQVARNRGVIILPRRYRIIWWLDRLAPALVNALSLASFRQYLKALDEAGR